MKNRIYKEMKIKISILAICTLFAGTCFAQQDPQYSNYMFNTLSVNPGYAGTRDALSALFIHRNQWVGLDGAPTTNNFTVHTPINFYNLGAGVSLVQDEIGPVQRTSAYVDIAYRIKTGRHSKLSFGLKGGINNYSANLGSLNTTDQGDNLFSQNVTRQVSPNFGFGAYYYSDRYYLGASAPRLLQNKFLDKNAGVESEEERHFFFIAGYVWDLGRYVKFKPSIQARVVEGAPFSLDGSANFLFFERLWTGVFWRRDDAVGLLTQYLITEQFHIGYAYGYTTSELNNFNSGTHELLISYDFLFKKSNVKSPRYF